MKDFENLIKKNNIFEEEKEERQEQELQKDQEESTQDLTEKQKNLLNEIKPRVKQNKTQLTIYLLTSQKKELERLCKKNRKSVNSVVVKLIDDFLKK